MFLIFTFFGTNNTVFRFHEKYPMHIALLRYSNHSLFLNDDDEPDLVIFFSSKMPRVCV